MPLVDSSILAGLNTNVNALPAAQQGFAFGQQIQQHGQQQQQYQRQQAFMSALDEAVKSAGDFTTPEGHQKIIQGLQQKGFGQEAMELEKKLQGLQPNPKPKTFQSVDTNQGLLPFDTETGTYGKAAADSTGNPIYSTSTAEKVKKDKADFNFGKAIPNYDGTLKGIGSDMAKRDLLASQILAEHPDSPKAERYVNSVVKAATAFNPATADLANSRKLSIYVSKFDHAQEQYEKRATPLQNLIGTINSPTWGTAAGDVSLINQLSLAEFGGYKPSEAEYKAFGKGFTPAEYAQKWLGLAQNGNTLPATVRENMVKEVEEVSRKTHENFKKTMEEQKKRVLAAGVNPDEVIYPGGTFQDLEEYFGKKPYQASAPAAAIKPHPQDNEAVQWAKSHPNDPRSPAILKANGL